ncbi:MAG TPA: 3D domain-containing protein [Chloroflexota bacterium]
MKRPFKTAGKLLLLVSLTLAASLLGATLVIAQFHIEPGSPAVVFGTGDAGLGVREGPGYNYPVLDTLPEGTQVDVLSGPTWKGYTPWYRIGGFEESGKQGWSAGNYLQPMLEPAETPEADAAAAPQPVAGRVATPSSRGGAREGRSFVALVTGYCIQGRTALGTPTQWGTLAVDPSVVPLGSRVQVEGFQEVFVAADTGGAVKGNWIDIYFPNPSDAYSFGIQARRVTILP